jgi:hypothetical protein
MTRPRWSTIGIRRGPRRITGAERLGLLLRWRRGDLLLGLVFFDTADDDRELANNPFVIDWTDFPTQEALEALSTDKK